MMQMYCVGFLPCTDVERMSLIFEEEEEEIDSGNDRYLYD